MMEKEQYPFRKYIRTIKEELDRLQNNPQEPIIYPWRIKDIEKKFRKFSEETTPPLALSDVYMCIGRLKFYGDGMMFVYLEIADDDKKQLAWPVRATWKVELIDGNIHTKNNNTLILGEATCIFNKPKQGYVSHPNDWISVSLERMRGSGLIATDNSVTFRWSVMTVPVLQEFYFGQFTELLDKAENYYDLFHGNAIQKLNDDIEAVNKNSDEHQGRILKLETLLPSINDKVEKIENILNFFMTATNNDRINNLINSETKQSVV